MCNEKDPFIQTVEAARIIYGAVEQHFIAIGHIQLAKSTLIDVLPLVAGPRIKELIKRLLVATEMDIETANDAYQLAGTIEHMIEILKEEEKEVLSA